MQPHEAMNVFKKLFQHSATFRANYENERKTYKITYSVKEQIHTFIYVAFGHGCVDKSRVKTIDFKARVGFGLNQGQGIDSYL